MQSFSLTADWYATILIPEIFRWGAWRLLAVIWRRATAHYVIPPRRRRCVTCAFEAFGLQSTYEGPSRMLTSPTVRRRFNEMSITACISLDNVCSLSSADCLWSRLSTGRPALTSRWKEWQDRETKSILRLGNENSHELTSIL